MTDETSHAKEGGPSNGPICLVSDIALPTSIIVASIVTLPHLWIYCNSFITSAFTLYSCVEIDGSKRILYPSLRNPTHDLPLPCLPCSLSCLLPVLAHCRAHPLVLRLPHTTRRSTDFPCCPLPSLCPPLPSNPASPAGRQAGRLAGRQARTVSAWMVWVWVWVEACGVNGGCDGCGCGCILRRRLLSFHGRR
jgi:hypothetical protein